MSVLMMNNGQWQSMVPEEFVTSRYYEALARSLVAKPRYPGQDIGDNPTLIDRYLHSKFTKPAAGSLDADNPRSVLATVGPSILDPACSAMFSAIHRTNADVYDVMRILDSLKLTAGENIELLLAMFRLCRQSGFSVVYFRDFDKFCCKDGVSQKKASNYFMEVLKMEWEACKRDRVPVRFIGMASDEANVNDIMAGQFDIVWNVGEAYANEKMVIQDRRH